MEIARPRNPVRKLQTQRDRPPQGGRSICISVYASGWPVACAASENASTSQHSRALPRQRIWASWQRLRGTDFTMSNQAEAFALCDACPS